MRIQIIACSMLREELNRAMLETGCTLPVHWMDRGLHNNPQHLREELQTRIDQLASSADLLLLAYGLCGGALDGLKSNGPKLVIPLFHDCIQMLLAGVRPPGCKAADSLYFTQSWLEDSAFLGHEYARFCAAHGEKTAQKVYRCMLQGYRAITLIDTGCYDLPQARATVNPIAQTLQLKCEVVDGSNRILRELLLGPWEESFCILNPGEVLTMNRFLDLT